MTNDFKNIQLGLFIEVNLCMIFFISYRWIAFTSKTTPTTERSPVRREHERSERSGDKGCNGEFGKGQPFKRCLSDWEFSWCKFLACDLSLYLFLQGVQKVMSHQLWTLIGERNVAATHSVSFFELVLREIPIWHISNASQRRKNSWKYKNNENSHFSLTSLKCCDVGPLSLFFKFSAW